MYMFLHAISLVVIDTAYCDTLGQTNEPMIRNIHDKENIEGLNRNVWGSGADQNKGCTTPPSVPSRVPTAATTAAKPRYLRPRHSGPCPAMRPAFPTLPLRHPDSPYLYLRYLRLWGVWDRVKGKIWCVFRPLEPSIIRQYLQYWSILVDT